MIATHEYRRNNPNTYDYEGRVHLCEYFEIGEIQYNKTVIVTCYSHTSVNDIEVVQVVRVENATKIELMSCYTHLSREKKE